MVLQQIQILVFSARKALTVGAANVSASIPLNRYSSFEDLEHKMSVPMHLQFNTELQNDNELILKHVDADAGRVVVNRFL